MRTQQPWWLSVPLAIFLLAVLDLAVRTWHPWPARLPENFSAAYFARLLQAARNHEKLILMAGDSAIWGYHVGERESLGGRLASEFGPSHVLNLSVEGGSPANSYVAVAEALRAGIRPALVVIDVNLKEFNPQDRSYQRILPAFEGAAHRLPAADQADFIYQSPATKSTAAQVLENYWMLYRIRTDIRQAIFGESDFAAWLNSLAATLTGRSARTAALNAPTADRYLGTYDLSPIADDNISLRYTEQTLALLRGKKIRTIVYLTPTNHELLRDYINVPEYDANLHLIERIARPAGPVFDWDRSFNAADFIDNDHLKAPAIAVFSTRIARTIRAELQ